MSDYSSEGKKKIIFWAVSALIFIISVIPGLVY